MTVFIGSNDLKQLILGVDQDTSKLSKLFDEQNDSVKIKIRHIIRSVHLRGCKEGICGQAPSDYPGFASFLVKEGIDSISLNPDSVIKVKEHVAATEDKMRIQRPKKIQDGVELSEEALR
ncbi:MAG: hypothetical protein JW932_06185 [Deltaproteobacteria bacterium]|nr:hypothetical protein [Deltaproteobacteria bacterium]